MATFLPLDDAGALAQLLPATKSLASTNNATLTTTSTDFTLNAKTRLVQFQAQGADVIVKFDDKATDEVTTSNFDVFIPDGKIIDRFLPEGTGTINARTVSGTVTSFVVLEY